MSQIILLLGKSIRNRDSIEVIEQLFHHLKNFKRIVTYYNSLNVIFRAFVSFGLTYLYVK